MTSEAAFYSIHGIDALGRPFIQDVVRPEHQIGDAKYFPEGLPAYRWMLRPLLTTDMIDGVTYRPGDSLLVRKLPGIGHLRNCVRLKRQHRRNTVANVKRAYRQFCDLHPDYPEFVDQMDELSGRASTEVGQDPPPAPTLAGVS